MVRRKTLHFDLDPNLRGNWIAFGFLFLGILVGMIGIINKQKETKFFGLILCFLATFSVLWLPSIKRYNLFEARKKIM